ncbi:hypothetical protein CMO83_02630 [Candidatus Woesearchaeota archaeon]|jgi:hypothetical protein|nr:hypothetical protein [Candidatus Woesearchaeota archaeon]|tara:strand:+ start:2335 stop:3363 length:1029 start_codon:yes stop_codon:yes gene_type:complete
MNKRYLILALFVCLILLISACSNRSGAAIGGAPQTPFIGGTNGILIDFERDAPPPEVTDDSSFAFNAIVRLKNEGEFSVRRDDIKLNLVGFDPADFGRDFNDLRDVIPDDDLLSKTRDAEGNIVEGTTTFAEFPRQGGDFIPRKFPGNTPFIFRADMCYNYETIATTQLCVLRDMINVRDDSICRPTALGTTGRPIYSSSAPVQVTNFRQSVVGRDKISFSFDIVLSGNVDIFWDRLQDIRPTTFDLGCPREARARRERESNVKVEITEIPVDPIFTSLKCGGLDNDHIGVVRLVNGRRTITCTADLIQDRLDLQKVMGVLLTYNVLDTRETNVLIKHLTEG